MFNTSTILFLVSSPDSHISKLPSNLIFIIFESSLLSLIITPPEFSRSVHNSASYNLRRNLHVLIFSLKSVAIHSAQGVH